jgi:hypothetical protein
VVVVKRKKRERKKRKKRERKKRKKRKKRERKKRKKRERKKRKKRERKRKRGEKNWHYRRFYRRYIVGIWLDFLDYHHERGK